MGLQGVSLQPDTKWIQKIQPILEKKAILGVDSWGGVDQNIRHIMDPIEQTFAEYFPNYTLSFQCPMADQSDCAPYSACRTFVEDFYPLLRPGSG